MKKLRLMNRQGGWEILNGFVGGPLLILFIGWMWLSGGMAELSGAKWLAMILASIASPFWLAYGVYRALALTTLWVEFSADNVRVRRLLGEKTYATDEVGGIRFDNKPINMSSSDTGIRINVAEARYVSVHDIQQRSLAAVRVTAADRSRLVRFLQDHGGRHWLPK